MPVRSPGIPRSRGFSGRNCFGSTGRLFAGASMSRESRDADLRMKFIRGEITFQEYKSLLSGRNTLRDRIRGHISSLLLVIISLAVIGFILSRLRIVVLIPVSIWVFLLIVLVTILVLFFVLDHFINPD